MSSQYVEEANQFPIARLTSIVSQALSDSSVSVTQWNASQMNVLSEGAGTIALLRCSGTAVTSTRQKNWSVIIKIVKPGGVNKFGHKSGTSSVHTEIECYRRNLFERRVGPFRAARCFLVDEHDDGLVWLWLEDLADLSGSMWSVSDYVDVSRAIGEFRGAWFLNEDQDISWLGRNMEIQELLTSELLANNRENLMSLKDSEYLREGLPGAVYEKALGLRDSLPSLAKAARGLEATLAHNDCHIRNLFVSKAGSSITDVVAVDFARVGVGHVGSYGGTMLASAFNWTDAESDVAIAGADLSYKAWLEGLRSTGLQIKDNVARFGYLFPFLRRTMMVSGILAWVALDSDFPLQRYGGRNDEMPLSIRKRLEFMHPLFDEARVLATQLPG